MTKENYTTLSNQELLLQIYKLNLSPKKLTRKYLERHHKEMFDELMIRTSFLEETDSTITPTTRIYCLEHDIAIQPICQHPNCTNHVHWNRAKRQFSNHCCVRCSMLEPKCKEQRESTCVKRLGVKNPSQSKYIQDKKNQTCLKNHGVEHPLQSKKIFDEMRQRFKENHGVEHPMCVQEFKDKLRKHYVEHHGGLGFQSKEVMEKIRRRCVETLGVENPSQSEIIKRRKEETCFRNHGVKNPCFLTKIKVRSVPEDELFQYVKSCVCENCIVIPNDRTQMVPNNRNNWKANHELDIWIPKLKVAIEFQGTFWHNPLYFPQNVYNDQEKIIQCREKGITLIQVNEQDWKLKRECVKQELRRIIDEKQAS